MSRPEHPGVPMDSQSISRLAEDQAYYDRDPERYERDERQHEEDMRQEQEAMEQDRFQYEQECAAREQAEFQDAHERDLAEKER